MHLVITLADDLHDGEPIPGFELLEIIDNATFVDIHTDVAYCALVCKDHEAVLDYVLKTKNPRGVTYTPPAAEGRIIIGVRFGTDTNPLPVIFRLA